METIKAKQSGKERVWYNHAQKKRELNLNTRKLKLNWRRTKSKVMEIIKQTQMNKMQNETLHIKRTEEPCLLINDP